MRRKKVVASQPKWKTAQQKKRREKQREILIRLISGLFFLALIFLSFFWLKTVKNSIWDGQHQLNFVVQADKLIVFSYLPQEESLNILIFPEETYIPAAYNLGNYPVLNIYQLGEDQKKGGGKLLALSLQNFLAAPIDGYFVDVAAAKQKLDSSILKSASLKKGKWQVLAWGVLRRKVKTNFSWWDCLRIFNQLRSFGDSQIKVFNFFDSAMLTKKTLADGSQILVPDFLRIDQLSAQIFSDKAVLDEGLTISIFNGSGGPGAAKTIGRLTKNIGLGLITTADFQPRKNSIIYWRDKKGEKSYLLF